jgi:HPt (histidine-containing phosphotransfer) domain-containing protein
MIRAAFAELHDEFASVLPGRIEVVAAAIRTADAARGDEALRDEARSAAHRLRGSAGSYGFPAISATAGRIEEALVALAAGSAEDPVADWATITAALRELESAANEG